MNTDRIKILAKKQGKTVTYVCQLIGRPKYYLNDIAKTPDREIPEDDLRTIAINLGTTIEYLKGETNDPNFHLSDLGMTTYPVTQKEVRPVVGLASAGNGVLAQQEILGYEAVSPEHDTDDFFWLKVEGDSMVPRLEDGDLALIQRDVPLESGTVMVVIVDDTEGFIKKVAIEDDTVTLHSFNPYYPPMVFGGAELGRLRFIGRVVKSERKW